MNLIPILQRELLVQARRPAMHWGRLALAGFFALAVVQHFFGWWVRDPVQAGQSAFSSAMALGFVLACAACLITADALSGERREGTLGLLLLTPMTVLSVVLGKLVSSGLTVLLALLGLIPALMIPVLAGGVTAGEAARSGLALVVTAMLALAAGLWVSAGECERSRAVRRSVWLMVALVLGPLPVAWGWQMAGLAAFFPSPLDALSAAGATTYPLAPGRYGLDLLVQIAGAALFLGLAPSRLQRQAWDETTPAENEIKGTVAVPFGAENPLMWRVRRMVAVRKLIWCAALLVAAGGSNVVLSFFFRTGVGLVASLVYYLGQWGGAALAAWAASRFFIETTRSGELELIRTTPLGAWEVIAAHRRVFASALRGPAAMIVGWGLTSGVAVGIAGSWGGNWFLPFLYVVALPLMLNLARLYLAVWLGMLLGLRVRRQATAVLLTVAVVEGLPLVAYLCFSLVLAALVPAQGGVVPSTGTQMLYAMIYLLGHPVLLIAVAVWARRKLGRLARASGAAPDPTLEERLDGARAAWRRARHWTPG